MTGKRHWGYPEEWLDTWRSQLTITPEYIERNIVHCAVDEAGRVVGFYGLVREGDHVRMEDLFIEPSLIGHGVGRQLFEHAVNVAQTIGVHEMLIESDPNAEGFYRRMGVRRIGEIVSRATGTERVIPLLRFAVPRPKTLAIELSASQESALRRLVGILERSGACYQFTGGFAGNLHGSHWPLHDLDLDVAQADLPKIADLLQPHTTQPLGLYVDDEFELQLMRGEIEGVPFDVSQAEDAFARVGGKRVSLGTNLERRQRTVVLGMETWVQPLSDLIAYKQLLGRHADLAELRELQARTALRSKQP
jgi:GNAT superfamily N-acetyltransferase